MTKYIKGIHVYFGTLRYSYWSEVYPQTRGGDMKIFECSYTLLFLQKT